MSRFMVSHNGHSWFVKEEKFFDEQGGRTEPWGRNWVPIEAEGIEHARLLAEVLAAQGIKPMLYYLYKTPPARVMLGKNP